METGQQIELTESQLQQIEKMINDFYGPDKPMACARQRVERRKAKNEMREKLIEKAKQEHIRKKIYNDDLAA